MKPTKQQVDSWLRGARKREIISVDGILSDRLSKIPHVVDFLYPSSLQKACGVTHALLRIGRERFLGVFGHARSTEAFCGVLAKNHRFETHSFVSALSSYLIDGIDWVICGAETGPGKRPMQLDWARSLRDQCQAAGVPFFFKRDGNGNRELDGRLWEEFPR